MIFTFSLLAKNPVAPAVKREAEEDWGRGLALTIAAAESEPISSRFREE